jgi:hypothetical protein
VDITQLILDDHHEQRRLFALLEEIDPKDKASLTAIWGRLSAFLEVHAEAEERYFYPSLLQLGKGAGGKPTAAAETEDAIEDHNEIRDAVGAVSKLPVGEAEWVAAVAKANKANSEHMGEEERQGLTDFRRNVDLSTRNRLGIAFAVFEAAHVTGVKPVDKDPRTYISDNEKGR